MKKTMLIAAGCLMALTSAVKSEEIKAFQASLTPEIAVQSRDTVIEGVSLNIWGENPQHGFALGFVNGSTGDSVGFMWGLVNYAENYTGVQWSLLNYTSGDFIGWQNGFINVVEGASIGFQSGVGNYAGTLTGLQLGLINYAENAHNGVQVGLVNVIGSNESWFGNCCNEVAPVMVLVNWGF